MPSFDFGAIFCWLNILRERRDSRKAMINRRFYLELPHVSLIVRVLLGANQSSEFIFKKYLKLKKN